MDIWPDSSVEALPESYRSALLHSISRREVLLPNVLQFDCGKRGDHLVAQCVVHLGKHLRFHTKTANSHRGFSSVVNQTLLYRSENLVWLLLLLQLVRGEMK